MIISNMQAKWTDFTGPESFLQYSKPQSLREVRLIPEKSNSGQKMLCKSVAASSFQKSFLVHSRTLLASSYSWPQRKQTVHVHTQISTCDTVYFTTKIIKRNLCHMFWFRVKPLFTMTLLLSCM